MHHVANVATKGQTKVAGLEKQAERDKLARDFNLASFTPEPGMIYTRVRAISARVNRNFDGFESSELKRAYRSFEGRPVFVNHENADPTRTRGIVVASAYREDGDDRYIELLIEVDARAFPKLAQEIADGNIDSVSMGCEVESTICSYCGNEADDLGEFCEHILNHKGQTLSRLADNGIVEDVLVYEICRGVNFFEISFVFDPADETALAQNVIDSRTAMRKRSYGERVAPQPVDTLTDSGPCPQCGTEDYNGKQCRWCDYIAPPEEFQDPDTSKAKENDLRDNSGTFDHDQHHQEDKTMPRPNNLEAALRERRRERVRNARRKNATLTPPTGGTLTWRNSNDNSSEELSADHGDKTFYITQEAPGNFSLNCFTDGGGMETIGANLSSEDEAAQAAEDYLANKTARRKRAATQIDWDDQGNGSYIGYAESLGAYYYIDPEGDGTMWVNIQRPGSEEIVPLSDTPYPDLDAAKAACLADAFNITARRERARNARRSAQARRKQGSITWHETPNGFEGENPNGEFYIIEVDGDEVELYLGDDTENNLIGQFGSVDEAKATAETKTARRKQASELEPDEIPADFPVRPLATQAEIDAATDPVQDGACGLWWDDAISTSYTPAPGGRCPFEAYHSDDGYYARRKRATLQWEETGHGFEAESPEGVLYTVEELEPGDVDVVADGVPLYTVNSVEEGKAKADAHASGITARRRSARRKRADADLQVAQPDERVNLDEQGDVTNKNTDLQVAQPDEKKDVEKVDEHQPSNATDSQQDATTYENQGGAPAKASAIQAMALVDAYEEMGLIGSDARIAKFAEFEKTSATIVQDRLNLLARVKEAGAVAPTRTAKRSTVPRSANRQRLNPSMGRVANSGADGQPSDYLMTL